MTCEEEIVYLKNLVNKFRYDYLTKLPQRHDFEQDLQQAFKINHQFILMMCDIDNLHTINRLHGYAAGDAIIISTAKALQQNYGLYGKFYKAGGADEFFGILNPKAMTIPCSIPNTQCAWVASSGFTDKNQMINAVDLLVTEKKKLYKKRRRTDI
jgi:diguanylate cyclase (GGDEF)-like protein